MCLLSNSVHFPSAWLCRVAHTCFLRDLQRPNFLKQSPLWVWGNDFLKLGSPDHLRSYICNKWFWRFLFNLIIIMYLRLTSTAASIASASVPSAALVLMLIVLTAIEVIIPYHQICHGKLQMLIVGSSGPSCWCFSSLGDRLVRNHLHDHFSHHHDQGLSTDAARPTTWWETAIVLPLLRHCLVRWTLSRSFERWW